ncbi:T9SS-dependent choice-of-anchor J family protein [Winogradskyella flava]|uniref:Choice-of-anchor J domain-containing protein n=1 Tax=Winogradskyella flava TaxID=1884876 RepID=A0A842IPE4_9FLAO|nr:choice-of-anchor J domain-containing protein [Winogradskyella flava]MBC2844535.1 choice-of-anchor J domain-containing protein [Winogradskyella flava]
MIKKITLLLTLCFACTQITTGQTILNEGFEGATFPPAGWTSYIGTNGLGTVQNWIQESQVQNTGNFSARNSYEDVTGGIAEDWLVTSQIDLTSSSNTQLSFYSSQRFTTNYGSNYEVRVSTASQTTQTDFTSVASYNESTVGGTGSFELRTVDLSAYDGMMIYIAFVHLNDDGDEWWIDDIEVRSPFNLDAELEATSLNRYSLTSVDNPLSVDVKNDGLTTITSIDIAWNDGTNSYSENFNVNIAPGQTQTLNHSTQVNYSTIEEKSIVATIENVNGGADDHAANNSLSALFNTITQSGTKTVLIEEATGTWCPWCPRGAVGLEYMATTYPNTVIPVAVHNTNPNAASADPMTLPEYDSGIGQYISGYPSSVIDRKIGDVDPGQSTLQGAYNQQINEIVPVDLTTSASIAGNDLTISANANFYTNLSNANFRLGVIITEDGLSGTTPGWAQANNYAGGGNGPMGGYENLPNPVPASQMVYDHVGIALLGGFNGQVGSVPTTISVNNSISYDFNYTIPATSNQDNMHIVVVLIDQTDGSIASASQSSVTQALSTNEFAGIDSIRIYPNPAQDFINVAFDASNGDYEITVNDMLGRTVIQKSYEGLFGNQNLELPVSQLNAGHYIMNINDNNGSYSTKFIVNK